MRRWRCLVALALAVPVLSGCMSWDTPYQPNGLRGGYSHEKLGDGDYRVVFRGNGFSMDDQAQDFALMRAAELCRDAGKAYMMVSEQTLGHEQLSYYDSTTYSMVDVGEAPVATVRVTCVAAAGVETRAVEDTIRDVRARQVENVPK